MTRRTWFALLAAVAAWRCRDGSRDGWITVAHPGKNLNNRVYHPETLRRIVDQSKSNSVLVNRPGAGSPMEQEWAVALGVVTDARLTCFKEVQVKVRWFGGKVRGYLTPNGVTRLISTQGYDMPGRDYRLVSFGLSELSSFQRATRIG